MIAVKIFLAALALNEAAASYSFLTNLSDDGINSIESDEWQMLSEPSGDTKYFVSQRIQLNWVEAFAFCKANGLRLARISDVKDLLAVSKGLSIHFPLGDTEVILDGSNSKPGASPCLVINAKAGSTSNISCTEDTHKFICEKFDEDLNDSDYAETLQELGGSTFALKHIGDYVDLRTRAVLKSYFIGSRDLQMQASDAAMFCQSMDMVLASPQSQFEYDNLRALLLFTTVEWDNLLAEFYRSEDNENEWMSRGTGVDFDLAFAPGQPDNYKGKEDCLVFWKHQAKMNDVPCGTVKQVLCERSQNAAISHHGHQAEASKFVERIASLSFKSEDGLITKRLYANQDFLTTTWLGAHQVCKTFGMTLFVPDTELELAEVQKHFENITTGFFVGATDLASHSWYSTVSGEPLPYNLNLDSEAQDKEKHCLMLQGVSGELLTKQVSCTRVVTNFICQERFVKSREEDVEAEAKYSSESEEDVDDDSSFAISWVYVPSSPLVAAPSSVGEPKYLPNFAACDNLQDIFDEDGNYIKTACQFSYPKSYDEACVDLGMNLFVIGSRAVEKQILAFATSIFGSHGGSTLWVNGKEDNDGNWFTFDGRNRNPLMSGIEGVETSKWNNQFSSQKDCLILRAWGNFEVSFTPCNKAMYGFCEYEKKAGSVKRLETSTTTTEPQTTEFSSEVEDSSQVYSDNYDTVVHYDEYEVVTSDSYDNY